MLKITSVTLCDITMMSICDTQNIVMMVFCSSHLIRGLLPGRIQGSRSFGGQDLHGTGGEGDALNTSVYNVNTWHARVYAINASTMVTGRVGQWKQT